MVRSPIRRMDVTRVYRTSDRDPVRIFNWLLESANETWTSLVLGQVRRVFDAPPARHPTPDTRQRGSRSSLYLRVKHIS